MKRLIIYSAVLFVFAAFTTEAKRNHNYGGYFYSELAPYGQWIEIDYGVVVWQPTIMQTGWAPYSMGRWIWTHDGWYWDSYESFGYVTYHYGRWFYDDYYGWLWYPDYEWAPAWVEWRYSNDYIGWAPLHPYATFSISIGIHFTHVYHSPYHHWHFITYNNFCHQYPYNYYVAPDYRYRVYSNTTYRTNYRYRNGRVQNRGIDIEYVRVRSGQEIRQREITRVRDPQKFRGGTRSGDEVRTLDVSRDQLSRNDVKNMNVKKDRRRTSLDVNRVEIGDKKRTTTITKNDNGNRNIDKQRNETRQNTVNRNDVKNNRNDKTTVTRNQTQNNRKQVNTNRNNNTNSNRNKVDKNTRTNKNEIKRNKTVNKNNVQRNDKKQMNTNRNNRNDRNIVNQNKTVNKNNVNRTQRTQVNTNKRNDVVKKNNTTKRFEKKNNKNNNTRVTNQNRNNNNVKRNNTQQRNTDKNNTKRKRTR